MSATLDRLLDGILVGWGGLLKSDDRAKIEQLDSEPSPLTWNNAYSIRIGSCGGPYWTLWTAMRRVDPRCPSGIEHGYALDNPDRWHGYFPQPFTLRTALRRVARPCHGVLAASFRNAELDVTRGGGPIPTRTH